MGRQRKTCTFIPCGRPNFAHGLCAGHAAQQRRGVELRPIRTPRPEPGEGMLWCGFCEQYRDETEFGWDSVRDQPKRTCRPCAAASQRAYVAKNADQVRLKVTLASWGITAEQYQQLFERQDHRCAICGAIRRQKRTLAIDHDHTSRVVRGLLCQDCNLGLGQFGDDPDRLEAAARYLRSGGVVHDASLLVPETSIHHRRAVERARKRADRP